MPSLATSVITAGIGALPNLTVTCVPCCKSLSVNFAGGVLFGLLFFGLVPRLVSAWSEFADFSPFGRLN